MLIEIKFTPASWIKKNMHRTVFFGSFKENLLSDAKKFCKKLPNKVYFKIYNKNSKMRWVSPTQCKFVFTSLADANWFKLRFSDHIT